MASESSTPAVVSDDSFLYDAFLSYRSATDYQQARRIEAFLESFHKNASSKSVKVRQLQICRDGSDFTIPRKRKDLLSSSNPEPRDDDPIWQIIQSELSKARFLIVLCSPGAVDSAYMSKEIRWFMANRDEQQIIPVVTAASDPKNKPDECFPPDITSSKLHESLIWYDLRGTSRFRRPAGSRNYEDEIVRLTADLLTWDASTSGPLSTIWQREQARRRRRQSSVVFIAAALFLAIGAYALISARQKEQALRQNEQLQSENQQVLDQRNKEVAERERLAIERNKILDERDKALAGEKAEARKAIKAAELAEKRGIEAERNGAEAKRQGQLAVENAKRVHANSLSTVANGSPDSLESALILRDMTPLIQPTSGPSTARRFINSPLPYALYKHTNPYENRLWAAAFTSDGNNVLIWPYSGEVVKKWRADGIGEAIDVKGMTEITGGPRIIVSYSDGSTVERPRPADLKQAEPLATTPLISTIGTDGRRVATISDKGEVSVWLNQELKGQPQRDKHVAVHWSVARTSQYSTTTIRNGMEFVWPAELSGESLKLYTLQQAESDPIGVAAFNHEGSLLATGSKSGVVRIWYLSSPDREPLTFQAHSGRVTSISYSHDGRLLTSSEDATASVWLPYDKDNPIVLKGHRQSVARAAFSPDSRFVTTASEDGTVRLWLSAGSFDPVSSETFYYNSPFQPNWFALSRDGSQAIIVSRDNVIRWYSTNDFERLRLLREERVEGTVLAISADGGQLAVLHDQKFLIYSLAGDFKARVLPFEQPRIEQQVATVEGKGEFTPDGRLLMFRAKVQSRSSSTQNGTRWRSWYHSVYIWDTQNLTSPIKLPGETVEHIAISADRRYVATTGEMDFERGVTDIRVCDVTSNKPCQVFSKHTAGINKIAFSNVGHYLVSTSNDRSACLWNVKKSDQCVLLPHGERVFDADFSLDGSKLVTTAEDNTVRIWSTRNPNERPFIRKLFERGRFIKRAMFSPDGSQVLAIFDYRVELWPNQGAGEPIPLSTINGLVEDVGFNISGDRVFVYNKGDMRVRVYRTSWSSLLDGFRNYLKICLPVSRRVELLGEAESEAQNSYNRCEQSISGQGISINK